MRQVEDDFTAIWKDTDDEKRQKAMWFAIHALAEIEAKLREIANNGEMEEKIDEKRAVNAAQSSKR